jgi:hypothetical protein
MYNVSGLRDKCETLLIGDLSTSNAVEYLRLALLYGAARLKNASMELITDNFDEIRKTPEWIQFRDSPKFGEAFEDFLMFWRNKVENRRP